MMKCEKCEKELSGGAVICRECGFNNALQRLGGWRARQAFAAQTRASQSASRPAQDATLIPFPISPSKARSPEAAEEPVWRAQLDEKIRQLRERRSAEQDERQAAVAATLLNPIVEAAVSRLRHAAPPRQLAPRSAGAGAQAAARALHYEAGPEPEREARPAAPPHPAPPVPAKPAAAPTSSLIAAHAAPAAGQAVKPSAAASPAATPAAASQTPAPPAATRSHAAEPAAHTETQMASPGAPTLTARAAASLIDCAIIILSALPFFTALTLFDAEFTRWSLYPLAGLALGLAFLYHLLTVAVAGRTSGMALLRLRVVDAASERVPPRLAQACARALGAMVSLLVLPLNLLVIWLSLERLSLSDYFSGTTLVRQ
jgi:uncharacterized RDD family membrane protein YckC